MAGGLPGGAITGRKDILDLLDFQVTQASDREKINHPGTFNANPLSAAAAVAALKVVGTTDACSRANRYGEELRRRINEVFEEERVPWAVLFPPFIFSQTPRALRSRRRASTTPAAGRQPRRQPSGRGGSQIAPGDDGELNRSRQRRIRSFQSIFR